MLNAGLTYRRMISYGTEAPLVRARASACARRALTAAASISAHSLGLRVCRRMALRRNTQVDERQEGMLALIGWAEAGAWGLSG
jgi:hypothetical protein